MNKTDATQSKTVDAELSAPVPGKTPKGRLITPFNLGFTKTKEFYGKVVAKSERNAVIAGLQKVAYAVATIFAAIVETLMNMGKFALNTVAISPINFVHGLVAKPKKGTEPVEQEKKVISDKLIQALETLVQKDKKTEAAEVLNSLQTNANALAQDIEKATAMLDIEKVVEEVEKALTSAGLSVVDPEVLGFTQAAQKEEIPEKKLDAKSVEEGAVIISGDLPAMQDGKASELVLVEDEKSAAAKPEVSDTESEDDSVESAVNQDNQRLLPLLATGVTTIGIVATAILYELSQNAMESLGI